MMYQDARLMIQSGDILAWTHKKWDSFYDFQIQMVRAFTQSEYSHVGIAWRTSGRLFVIEAVSPEVRIYPLSKTGTFYWLPCGHDYWNPVVELKALEYVGDKYSKMDALKAFFGSLVTGKDNMWQCAELVYDLLRDKLLHNIVKPVPSNIVNGLMERNYPLHMVTQ